MIAQCVMFRIRFFFISLGWHNTSETVRHGSRCFYFVYLVKMFQIENSLVLHVGVRVRVCVWNSHSSIRVLVYVSGQGRFGCMGCIGENSEHGLVKNFLQFSNICIICWSTPRNKYMKSSLV